MSWTSEDLRDARELDQFDHGTRATSHLNNAATIDDIFDQIEREHPHVSPEVPKAERVSLRGFRIGDQVTVPVPAAWQFEYMTECYNGTWTVTFVANPFVDEPEHHLRLRSNVNSMIVLYTSDEHLQRVEAIQ